MKTTFKSPDLKMSIISNVRSCWLAMPPVAGVPYNREKNESLACTPTPLRTYLSVCLSWIQEEQNSPSSSLILIILITKTKKIINKLHPQMAALTKLGQAESCRLCLM